MNQERALQKVQKLFNLVPTAPPEALQFVAHQLLLYSDWVKYSESYQINENDTPGVAGRFIIPISYRLFNELCKLDISNVEIKSCVTPAIYRGDQIICMQTALLSKIQKYTRDLFAYNQIDCEVEYVVEIVEQLKASIKELFVAQLKSISNTDDKITIYIKNIYPLDIGSNEYWGMNIRFATVAQ